MLVGISLLEEGQQLAAEEAAEHAHGQKEPASSWDPAGVVEGETAAGDETMEVGMMPQSLRPRVQHCQYADACAEMAGSAAITSKVSAAARNSRL